MSQVVLEMASTYNINTLLDLGSGKAYLSQVVTAQSKDLRVLAVDSSQTNSNSASKRSHKLEVGNKKFYFYSKSNSFVFLVKHIKNFAISSLNA